jgi:hypothetical protein
MPELQGRRLATLEEFYDHDKRQPGDYVRVTENLDNIGEGGEAKRVIWYICDPFGEVGALRTHDVTEHDDGTITVSPSIAPDSVHPGKGFHGFLKAGVWSW